MNFQDALSHLDQGRFSPVYLITGDEPFLIEILCRTFLKKGLAPAAHGFNHQQFRGGETTPATILAIANTFPISSPRRMIFIQNADQLKDDRGLLLDYLAAPAETTTLIFIAAKADMRKKFFSTLKKRAKLITCPRPQERELPHWIRQEAQKMGLHLSEEVVWFLKEHLGRDLLSIHQEIEKLVLYQAGEDGTGTKNISVALAQKVIGNGRTHSIFEMTAAVGKKDFKTAFEVQGQMLAEGAHPLFILTMLLRLWRQMAIAKNLLDSGGTKRELAKKVPMPPSLYPPFLQQLKKWSQQEIQKAFDLCLSADSQLKGGVLPARSILETLLLDLCRAQDLRPLEGTYSLPFLSQDRAWKNIRRDS